jgi:protein TonB
VKKVAPPPEPQPETVQPEPVLTDIPVEDVQTDNVESVTSGPAMVQVPVNPEANYVSAHFESIRREIQEQIIYPIVARRKGWQGKVKISFVVDLDGSIRDLEVLESSGYKLLDDKAIATVKKAAPFPHPPVIAKLIIPVLFRLT